MQDKRSNLDITSQAVDYAIQQGADAADAVIIESSDISYRHRMGSAESIEKAETKDIGIRVFIGDKKGYRTSIISTNNLSDKNLKDTVSKVLLTAKLAPIDENIRLAEKGEFTEQVPNLDLLCKEKASPEQLIEWASEAEEAALSDKKITNSEGADSSYNKSETVLVTSEGFSGSYETSGFSITVSVIAGEGTSMETDYDFNYARHREDLMDPSKVGASAAKRTIAKLNPRKVNSAKVPIVFDRRISKSLISGLTSAINGSAVVKNSSFLSNKLGEQLFPKHISIIDDPLKHRAINAQPFDAEGILGEKIALIKEGRLDTWITDLRSAKKLGTESTGRATRSINGQPSPSPTNVYMENGSRTPEEIIKEIKNGLYLTEVFGMGVNNVTGDYSQGAAGFWIENGEICYPVSGITVAGNLIEMFKNLEPANDLEFRYSKNAPTLRVDGMTVAGN